MVSFPLQKNPAAAPWYFSLSEIFRLRLVTECLVKTGQAGHLNALENWECLLYASMCVLFQRMLLGLDSGKPGFEVGNLMVIRAAEESY